MRANTSILTDAGIASAENTVLDYSAGVFAHTTRDYAQHSQMLPYAAAFNVTGSPQTVALVNVAIYRGFHVIPNDLTLTNFFGSFTSPDITFGTQFHFAWHPFGLTQYGYDINASIIVPAPAVYTFTIRTGTYTVFFVDGTFQLKIIGDDENIRTFTKSVSLGAGVHTIRLKGIKGSQADHHSTGIDFTLPSGVTYGTAQVSTRTIATMMLRTLLTDDSGNDLAVVIPMNSLGTTPIAGQPPIIVKPPQNTNAFIGNSVTLSVTAVSDTALSYQWQKNTVDMPGQSAQTLTIINAQTTDTAQYRVVVTNANGTTTSLPAQLTVTKAPRKR